MWEHIPDGEPYIFEDPDNPGEYRVYIYGSHDSNITEYCGRELVVWSASPDNLNEWLRSGKTRPRICPPASSRTLRSTPAMTRARLWSQLVRNCNIIKVRRTATAVRLFAPYKKIVIARKAQA